MFSLVRELENFVQPCNFTSLQNPSHVQATRLLLHSMLPLNTSAMSFFLIASKLILGPPVSTHTDLYLQGRQQATRSSVLAQRIPQTEEPGGVSP